MFFISMPTTFRVGQTEKCRINGEDAEIHWRDKDTLVIMPNDVRTILTTEETDTLISFTCGDAGEAATDYRMDVFPKGGHILTWKPPVTVAGRYAQWAKRHGAKDRQAPPYKPTGF